MSKRLLARNIALIASLLANIGLYVVLDHDREAAETVSLKKNAGSKPDEFSKAFQQGHSPGLSSSESRLAPARVELPWQLVRPILAVVPFESNGAPTAEFTNYLGLTEDQTRQIAKFSRAAFEAEAARVASTIQVNRQDDGKISVHIPPRENEAVREILSKIESMNLAQFPVIKTMIQDSVRLETQMYGRDVSGYKNADGSIILTEILSYEGKQKGNSRISYPNRASMPLEYGLIADRYLDK